MALPLTDWQFWVVTALAMWGMWMLIRTFLPSRGKRRGRKVNLTIGGKRN